MFKSAVRLFEHQRIAFVDLLISKLVSLLFVNLIEFDKLGYIADSAIIGDSCGAHHSIRHQILISRVALTIGNDRRRHLVKY